MGIVAKMVSKTVRRDRTAHLLSGFVPETGSLALGHHIVSQSKYFWRSGRLLWTGKTEKDVPAFPLWQVLKEILDFTDRDDEFTIGVKKGYEYLFNKIIYEGAIKYKGEIVKYSNENFGEVLGYLLLTLLNRES